MRSNLAYLVQPGLYLFVAVLPISTILIRPPRTMSSPWTAGLLLPCVTWSSPYDMLRIVFQSKVLGPKSCSGVFLAWGGMHRIAYEPRLAVCPSEEEADVGRGVVETSQPKPADAQLAKRPSRDHRPQVSLEFLGLTRPHGRRGKSGYAEHTDDRPGHAAKMCC